MSWPTDPTKSAIETARPHAVIPIYFTPRSNHLWAEDNNAGIKLYYGDSEEEINRIEFEFPNSTISEHQRDVLKALAVIVSPEESANEFADWVLETVKDGENSNRETSAAWITLIVNSQRATLSAIPMSEKPEGANVSGLNTD